MPSQQIVTKHTKISMDVFPKGVCLENISTGSVVVWGGGGDGTASFNFF